MHFDLALSQGFLRPEALIWSPTGCLQKQVSTQVLLTYWYWAFPSNEVLEYSFPPASNGLGNTRWADSRVTFVLVD